jgi:hypothetical protein
LLEEVLHKCSHELDTASAELAIDVFGGDQWKT